MGQDLLPQTLIGRRSLCGLQREIHKKGNEALTISHARCFVHAVLRKNYFKNLKIKRFYLLPSKFKLLKSQPSYGDKHELKPSGHGVLICLCLSVRLSICFCSVGMSITFSVCLFVCLSVCLSFSVCLCVCVCLSFCLYINFQAITAENSLFLLQIWLVAVFPWQFGSKHGSISLALATHQSALHSCSAVDLVQCHCYACGVLWMYHR